MVHPLYSSRSQTFDERPATFSWASVRQEFAGSPTRVQSALRMAVGCTVSLLLAFLFNWSPVSTALIPSLLLNRPDVRYDLPQALWTAGAAAASGLFFYWTLNFSQDPLWFALVLGGGLTVFGALTTLPTVGPAFSIGQVLSSSVLANDFYAPNAPSGVFLPLAVELTLGFSVALLVEAVVWPYSPRREWDERFRRAWGECRKACAGWFAGEELEEAGQRPGKLDRQLEDVLGLLHERIQPVDPADQGQVIRRAASRRLEEIIVLLQDLRRLGRGEWPEHDPAGFARLGRGLDVGFERLGALLGAGNPLATIREPGAGEAVAFPLPTDDTDAVRQDDLRRLQHTLDDCPEVFRALAGLPTGERLTQRQQNFRWTPPFQFSDLGKLDAQSWRQGVKIALVVLLAFGTWQALRLPSGATVLFLALLVMLPDLGRSSRQAIDCALGVLLGLVLAFLSVALVVKYVETIYGYGACVFVVLAFLGYLAGASPRLAYVGFQGAISYVVVFVSSDRQSVNLEPLRERFVALSFGVTVAMIVLHNLWPVRKVKPLFKKLADNLALCAQAWSSLSSGPRDEVPARQDQFMQNFGQGLTEAAVLVNTVEFEGGEGTPRYGYAGRLLTHEVALFEQLHLFDLDWAELAAVDGSLSTRAEAIGERLQTLAKHLGRPADPPPSPREPIDPPPSPTTTADHPDAALRQVLAHRAGEIEEILASLERLTSLPPSP